MLSDEFKLENLQKWVDQAVLDKSKWRDVCDGLAEFLGGVGTLIIPETIEYQVPDMAVLSPSLEGLAAIALRDGWVHRNYRRRSYPLIKQRGFATDYDIADERTLRLEPFYADLMASQKLGTFVGLRVLTTTQTFMASVQRSATAPPPDDDLFQKVQLALPILSAGARASAAVGSLRFESWKELAADGARAIFILDHQGRVIDRNAASEPLIGGAIELAQGQVRLRDPRDNQQLDRLVEVACADSRMPLPRPVLTVVPGQGGLMLEAVRLPDSLRFFHVLGRAMLIVRQVEDKSGDLATLLRRQAGLTGAELKVALALFEGQSLAEFAQAAGISTGTARQQLKAVYRKTGTNRQNELSALIRRLVNSISN